MKSLKRWQYVCIAGCIVFLALAFFGWLMPNREASYESQMLVPFLRLILAIVFGVQAIGLTVVKKALLEKQEQ